MFNAVRILVSTLVIATAGGLLGGCGQTGPLYLAPATPSKKPTPKPAQAPSTQDAQPFTGG